MRSHRSLLVSISPKSSRLPPLRAVPAEVADTAEEWVEKAVEGLLASGKIFEFSVITAIVQMH